jgi:purine-binding chemotaxis protein CheW
MQNLFLIAVIAGTEVAISSNCIESVVNIGDVVQVPQSHALVAGLIALRSRVLTLIDCQYAVTGERQAGNRNALAVIATIGGHPYALVVDAVRDVVSVEASAIKPATKLDPRWMGMVGEVVEVEDRVVMLLSPELLLVPQQALAA